jgi:hypothetical protein
MAKISHYEVLNCLAAAENEFGKSETARDLSRRLLSEIITQELRFAKSAERKATQAEAEWNALILPDSEDIV